MIPNYVLKEIGFREEEQNPKNCHIKLQRFVYAVSDAKIIVSNLTINENVKNQGLYIFIGEKEQSKTYKPSLIQIKEAVKLLFGDTENQAFNNSQKNCPNCNVNMFKMYNGFFCKLCKHENY